MTLDNTETAETDDTHLRPATVLDVARVRGVTGDRVSMADLMAVGLPFWGGCAVCHATVSAGNACPSRSGYLKCVSGCIGDDGFCATKVLQPASRPVAASNALQAALRLVDRAFNAATRA